MSSLVLKEAPFAGVVRLTVGGVFPTEIVTVAVVVAPSASVTDAVIVWGPFVSRLESVAPDPSAPSRLDDQVIELLRLPWSKSLAVALNWMRSEVL
jgi:hypothetical protein